MPITDPQAVDFGFLVAFAEDMYVQGSTTPHAEPRIAAAGWDVVGHFLAFDSVLPNASALPAGVPCTVQLGQTVFYGFLARNHADPTRYAAAIRGTSGFAEWVIDADFLPLPLPSPPGATVENGFWSIYDSMTLVALNGAPIGAQGGGRDREPRRRRDGDGLRAQPRIGARDLSQLRRRKAHGEPGERLPVRVSAVGQRRVGGGVRGVAVSTYRLINYVLGVVPCVPFDAPPAIQYSTLPGAQILQPSTAQAEVQFDIRCNHNVICYCAMIDYADTKTRASARDAEAWRCILGPPAFGLNRELTLALAKPVIALGGAAEHIVELIDVTARAKGGHV